jgi:hypothetical protein
LNKDMPDRILRLLEHSLVAVEKAGDNAKVGSLDSYRGYMQQGLAAIWAARGLIAEMAAELTIEKARRGIGSDLRSDGTSAPRR